MKKTLLALSIGVFAFSADYIVGGGIGRSIVSHSPIDDYNFANIRIGKYLPKNHILRAELERSEKVSGEHITRALLNVEHYFNIDSKFTPYALLGAGYQWVSGGYDDNIVGDLGAGVKYAFNKTLDGFAEIRALRDFDNNDNHISGLLGVVYKIGSTPKAPVVKDSDNDGVNDNNDKCPNTPAGVSVDAKGCALDSDNDGVADYLDKCPNTPAGVSVDSKGCALDSDNDGVADYLDKCPNTPKGFEVDKNGCAVMYNLEINFDTDKAVIKPEYMPKVQKLAEFLKSHPNVKVVIEGYTDNRGNADYNLKLSQRRAKAVYEALIKLGIDKERLSYKGYGEANPIADNSTEEGRAKNRRVVAKLSF
ncbi:MAG: OmpA family protein [Epsilonproteobacteria bacterium]|nr:OmpA family protein [Campylobacterota bacterium]